MWGVALPVHRLVPRRAAGHTRHTDTLVQAVDLVRERLRRDMGIREILADLFEQCLSPHPSANEVASPTPPLRSGRGRHGTDLAHRHQGIKCLVGYVHGRVLF